MRSSSSKSKGTKNSHSNLEMYEQKARDQAETALNMTDFILWDLGKYFFLKKYKEKKKNKPKTKKKRKGEKKDQGKRLRKKIKEKRSKKERTVSCVSLLLIYFAHVFSY